MNSTKKLNLSEYQIGVQKTDVQVATDHCAPLKAGSADTMIRFAYMNQGRQLLLVSTFLNTGTPFLASSDWCRIHFLSLLSSASIFLRNRYQKIFSGQADTPELDYLFSNTY